ncbi:MAG: SIMPL domain-containing protein [Patescibacteria group bacterium]|jgi:hypothetical protein
MEEFKEKWLQPKNLLILAGILLIGAVVIVALLRDRIVNPNQNQVSVTGQGKVSYVPDIANITLGVQIDKMSKADEALNKLNGDIKKIIEALKKTGAKEEDIQTQNYSLYPQYDVIDNVSKLTGYSANQQLIVKVKDFKPGSDTVSKIISEASKAGANQVNGINFTTSKEEELKQEARIKAIEDARSKADSIANAAGVKLGKVIGWWENIVFSPSSNQSYFDGKGGMGGGGEIASPSIPSGTQEIIIELNLNYRVK